MVCIPMVCIPMVCIPMVCIPMYTYVYLCYVYLCIPIYTGSIPGVYREYTGSIPGVYREYTGSIPGVFFMKFSTNFYQLTIASFRIGVYLRSCFLYQSFSIHNNEKSAGK